MTNNTAFLCHSSEDKPFVDRVASDLERLNIDVWYDKWEIKVGDSIIDKISEGISTNDYLVIFMSKASVVSRWVKKELNTALFNEIEGNVITVLPVRIEDCAIPPFLKEKKYADFVHNYEDGFNDLLHAIYPENPILANRSRKFRLRQYYISGLADIDETGENILNKDQLSALYEYSNELSSYMDEKEFRLILWSILAFKKRNPKMPLLTDISTPCWKLLQSCTDENLAKWIVEGCFAGRHLSSFIDYYEYAISFPKCQDESYLSMGVLMNMQMDDDPLEKDFTDQINSWRYGLFKIVARYNPELFKTIWGPDMLRHNPPLHSYLISTSGYLKESFSFDKYTSFIDIDDYYFRPTIYSLCNQQNFRVMDLISDDAYDKYSLTSLDIAYIFQNIKSHGFGEPLREMINTTDKIDLAVSATLALANIGLLQCDELLRIIRRFESNPQMTAFGPLLVAAMRLVLRPNLHFLTCRATMRNTVVAGEAIVGLIKFGGELDIVKIREIGSPWEDEVAPYIIQAIEKYNVKKYYYLTNEYITHPNPKVRSCAAVAQIKLKIISDRDILVLVKKEKNIYALLAIVRSLVQTDNVRLLKKIDQLFTIEKADREDDFDKFIDNLKTKRNSDLIRATCDEGLYMRKGLEPSWWRKLNTLDQDAARIMPSLTNLIPASINLNSNHVINRSIDAALRVEKTGI